jgi:hypothetical protein
MRVAPGAYRRGLASIMVGWHRKLFESTPGQQSPVYFRNLSSTHCGPPFNANDL